MKFNLKLLDAADGDAAARVRALATSLGATRVEALFPTQRDAGLRALFVVEAPDDADAEALRTALERDDAVEFVEGDVDRRVTRDR